MKSHLKVNIGAGEVPQQLRALAVLPEDPILNTSMAAPYNCL